MHELLLALDRTGLDSYTRPNQLLDLFQRMQEFQIRRTRGKPRPRHQPPRPAQTQARDPGQ
ncbi:MAG: hypothetical protein WDM96_06700 [Lacunisphaera sp.]